MGKYMSVTYNAQAVTDPIHPKRPACRKPALELLLNPRAPAPWQHSHQELDKSYGLPETSTSAVPIPALPALLQDWPKSPSPRNNNTHTDFTKVRMGQRLHRIYSKQKKRLSLQTSWNTLVWKRTQKVFSVKYRDCGAATSTMMPQESCLVKRREKVPSSALPGI